MSRYIDADALHDALKAKQKWVVRCGDRHNEGYTYDQVHFAIDDAPSIDIVFCENCRKSHIDGKTTHHLWCTEWGRSTDTFGYCERGEREDE